MRRVLVVLVAALVVAGALLVSHVRGGDVTTNALGAGEGGGSAGPQSADDGRLTPALTRAITRAEAAAAQEGVEVTVTSGWRSAAHQQELYEQAIAKYGSAEIARQWVLPPRESAHVRGEAIDVGPERGASWLETNGVRFGLCRVYENESWHFELLAPALGQPCPALKPHA